MASPRVSGFQRYQPCETHGKHTILTLANLFDLELGRSRETATSPPSPIPSPPPGSPTSINSDPGTRQQANPHPVPNPNSNARWDCHRLLRFVPSLSPHLRARPQSPLTPRPRDGGLRRPPRSARQVRRRRRRRGQVSERSFTLRASGVRVLVRACAFEAFDEMVVAWGAAGSRRRTGSGRAAWTWQCSRRPTGPEERYGRIPRAGFSGMKELIPWWAHFGSAYSLTSSVVPFCIAACCLDLRDFDCAISQ